MGFVDLYVKTIIELFGPLHGHVARVIGSLNNEFAYISQICISVGCSRDFVGAVIDDLVRLRMVTRSGEFITKPKIGKCLFKALKEHGLVTGTWSQNFWSKPISRKRQPSIQNHWSLKTPTRPVAAKNKRNSREKKRA